MPVYMVMPTRHFYQYYLLVGIIPLIWPGLQASVLRFLEWQEEFERKQEGKMPANAILSLSSF